MNEKARMTGRMFAPGVTCETGMDEKSGSHLRGSIFIGEDYYYETDAYKDKEGVVSELIGHLEVLKEKIEKAINELKDDRI